MRSVSSSFLRCFSFLTPLRRRRHHPTARTPAACAFVLTATVIFVFGAFAARGQSAQTGPASEGAHRSTVAAGLDPSPVSIDPLGLQMNLPLGASVAVEKFGDRTAANISDNPAMPTWSLRIQAMTSTLQNPTPAAQIEDLLRELRSNNERFTALTNEPVRISGLDGHLCYLKRTAPSGEQYISGWLLLPIAEREMMVLSLQTLPDYFEQLRPTIDASFQTISLRSLEEIAAERKTRLEAGQAFLQSITPEQLKSLVGLKQLTRIYRPASTQTGAPTELGYSLLEVLEAKKGQLNPERHEASYDADARQLGLMVKVHGRVVVDADRNIYYDSLAMYWMAWDQSEEAWSVLGTHRQGDATQTEAETGVRNAALPGTAPRLTVIKADNATNYREPHEWLVPDVYMSQPIGWLLSQLLPKDITAPQEYSYYTYNFASRTPHVSQRLDIWAPARDGSDTFTLTTRLSSDAAPVTAIYTRSGDLVRRIHSNGVITEPVALEELRRLWRAAGLQLGGSN